MLTCILLFVTFTICKTTDTLSDVSAVTRTIDLSHATIDDQNIFDEFENVTVSNQDAKVSISGTKKFDTSSLSEIDLISLETDFGKNLGATYNLELDSDTGNLKLGIQLITIDGEVISDTLTGLLTTNKNGQPDGMFLIDGETVLLSELCGKEIIDNVGIFSKLWNSIKNIANKVIGIVKEPLKVTVIMLAPTAKLLGGAVDMVIEPVTAIKSTSNYSNNMNTTKVIPVNKYGYIDNQNDTAFTPWKFGFRNLNYNGCGIIATYNALVFSDKITNDVNKVKNKDLNAYRRENLAKIIKGYEMSSGALITGELGVNPAAISTMLMAYGVNVSVFAGLSGNAGFEYAYENLKSNQMAILCYWWNFHGSIGAHYITITKSSNGPINYNCDLIIGTSLSEFFHGKQSPYGFIQGWIINK